ncbi:MAG: NAD(P)-binding domain-containing protein, partial [Candidatus Babeliales bacterium]
YKDSQRRELDLTKFDTYYLDCGTSGGLEGRNIGFSLMVGGCQPAYDTIVPLLESLAAPNGYGYMGQSGSGHYVKMVHNGIEYALLQSLGDGFNLLKNGPVKDLDLKKVSRVWSNGSVIRSWLMDLSHNIFEKDQNFDTISGAIGGGETGRWTTQTAKEANISVPMIEQALKIRDWSIITGGNYATKLVAMLRNQFGGHTVKKIH